MDHGARFGTAANLAEIAGACVVAWGIAARLLTKLRRSVWGSRLSRIDVHAAAIGLGLLAGLAVGLALALSVIYRQDGVIQGQGATVKSGVAVIAKFGQGIENRQDRIEAKLNVCLSRPSTP